MGLWCLRACAQMITREAGQDMSIIKVRVVLLQGRRGGGKRSFLGCWQGSWPGWWLHGCFLQRGRSTCPFCFVHIPEYVFHFVIKNGAMHIYCACVEDKKGSHNSSFPWGERLWNSGEFGGGGTGGNDYICFPVLFVTKKIWRISSCYIHRSPKFKS